MVGMAPAPAPGERVMAIDTASLSSDEREALARLINLECDDLECARCRRIRWRISQVLRTYDGARYSGGGFVIPQWKD